MTQYAKYLVIEALQHLELGGMAGLALGTAWIVAIAMKRVVFR